MEFMNRVGGVLKQAVRVHASSRYLAPSASLTQATRTKSPCAKLLVGGLSCNTDETSLKEAFSQYGLVVEARVISNRETGRSQGIGFISFASTKAASNALQAFDGQDLHGQTIRVNYAKKPCANGFGGGYGSRGYDYANLLYQDLNMKSYFGSIRPPTRNTFGFRLGRCVITQLPKRTLVHLFALGQSQVKRREKSRPGKVKGRWWQFRKVGPIKCLH